MEFLDRQEEMRRLDALAKKPHGGLAVIYGRRRVGKTRLLLEWCRNHGGAYTVADPSAAPVQRRYCAESLSQALPGFHEVEYPDWRSLLRRLASEARSRGWRGPVVFDELPFLVAAAPQLPGTLQHWIDHEARQANLVIALAGSSQRMMQGLVLDSSAPLYGRAAEILQLRPLLAGYIREALGLATARQAIEAYAVWGGTPRYWELAEDVKGDLERVVDRLVLDPLAPLHEEPDRLLMEEVPPATALRPVLDAIGMGAHRVSEIAARIGQPATALSRGLRRLQQLDLIRREVPFGQSEKASKKALYRMADPFFALWFRVVAPRRAQLAEGSPSFRRRLWREARASILAETWELLVRQSIPRMLGPRSTLGALGPWTPASRFWQSGGPEWDAVALSADGKALLLAEAKWPSGPTTTAAYHEASTDLLRRGVPPLGGVERLNVVRAVFLPEAPRAFKTGGKADPLLVTAAEVVAALR